MKAYEVWQGESYSTIFPEDHPQKNILIEEDAKQIATIYAASWDEAMIQYHELMGWEPYVPMD